MLIVQKFGGTSMGTIERIKHVASKVIKEHKAGNKVCVVVSAMSGETNRLVGLVKDSVSACGKDGIYNDVLAEYDSIISTGEQVSAGLLASMLISMGYKSRSFLSWQIKFKTDDNFSKAMIEEIDSTKLIDCINKGVIPIITGFQGVHIQSDRVTTIGRGGSDTTAVAVAAAIKADRCDIYTDVDGVYTTDPRIVKNARKINEIGFEEMIEMSSSGAKVLHVRSAILAMNYGVVTRILSTFSDDEVNNGSILKSDDSLMEKRVVTAVTADVNEVQVAVFGCPDKPGICYELFSVLASNGVNIDMIVQCPSYGNTKKTDLAFTVSSQDKARSVSFIESVKDKIGYENLEVKDSVAKVSIIGAGMTSHPGVASKMFGVLSKENINVIAITTSEMKISVLIDVKYCELAVRALHDGFELDKM